MEKKNIKYYVQRFVDRNPFIKEGLYQWYINSTGLTLILHSYIKDKMKEDVSFDSVKMALFRIGKNIVMPEKKDLFKTKEIFINKWINLFNIEAEEALWKVIRKVKWKYYTSIRWKNQKTYIFDDFYKKEVIDKFDNEKYIFSDLIIVWIKLDESKENNIQNVKGVFYLISKNLYFYGVNIIQIIQTQNEFSVVIEEKYLKDAIYAISSI